MEKKIQKYELETKRLAFKLMLEGRYQRAFELMRYGRETVQKIRRIQHSRTTQYKHLFKETYGNII